MTKTLIVYYSHSGNTEKVAEMIRQKSNGTLLKIEPENPYPQNYNAVVEQAKKGIQAGIRPTLKTMPDNIEIYDTIFIGSPNWWNTIAPPIATFLMENDLSGKTVVPFYTHGGGGSGNIERDIAKLCPQSKMQAGLSINGSSCSNAQVSTWLSKVDIAK